jgi:hypothetical protein
MKIIFGLSLICMGLFFFACKKSKPSAAPPPQSTVTYDTAGSDTLFYYSFQLDSVSFGEYAFSIGYGIYETTSNVAVSSIIQPSGGFGQDGCCTDYWPWDTTAFIEIIGGLNNNPDSGATLATFDSLLNVGASLTYGSSYTNGLLIYWVDRSGNLWTTNHGSGDQTGSSFLITERKLGTGFYPIIITASFNCKLYDSTGDMRILTNGRSRLPFDSGLTH